MIGLTALLGYPGEDPRNSAIAYPDAVAGLAGAASVLTALVHKARSGRGQFLDLSQLEATTLMLGEYFIAFQEEGRRPDRAGNAHPLWAPHGTYRCRGEDEWVSLAVRSDQEWAALCRVCGWTAIASNPDYATAAGRRNSGGLLDAAISTWTRARDKFEAMESLQRAGVPAGAVLNGKELVENPHLASRGFFVQALARDGGSDQRMPGTPIVTNGERRAVFHAPPGHGEHNRTVLKEILDLSDAEIESLTAAGALVGGDLASSRQSC
jgi:crotonobetainyl-CoA:carnitine CoA-transferase CaiB-like acyl-CoA transferase